jgi:hypothetical protein
MILKDPRTAKLEQKMSGLLTVMVLVMLVLLIQLWLLNIAVEAYLAAHAGLAVPTFLASMFCFALNLAALKYLYVLDRQDE